jgi:phosphoribosylformimino-5-aminoimidazole carboxamide ribotide isomerase
MTQFRPCIDLHEGEVKQIVGSTLESGELVTNFVGDQPAEYYAGLYGRDGLTGGHVIMLGPGNDEAAAAALAAYPGGLQVGGGIHAGNALRFIELGASHVIVTSAIFDAEGRFQEGKLRELSELVGSERLVVDLSCRAAGGDAGGWTVAMNRWRTLTDLPVTIETLDRLAVFCDEFLIHAADVEGKGEGIEEELVRMLGSWGERAVTYAGGARNVQDLALVGELSGGKVDLTIGSALDIFGGKGVRYEECVAWNEREV